MIIWNWGNAWACVHFERGWIAMGMNRPPWRFFLWRMRIVVGKKLAMTARLGAICPGMRSDHNIRATRAGRTAQVWLWREQIAPLSSINCRIGEHD